MDLIDALSPDWKECKTCKKLAFVPKNHDDCYDCLNIWYGNNPYRGYRKVPIPQEIRLAVFERDNFTCKECGSKERLHADHIFPESKGGLATMENLQTLCKTCNCRKGSR